MSGGRGTVRSRARSERSATVEPAELKTRAAAVAQPIERANGLAYRPTGATLGALVWALGDEKVELVAASLERDAPAGESVSGTIVILTASLVVRAELERAWVPFGPRHPDGPTGVSVARRSSLRSVRLELPDSAPGSGGSLFDVLAVPWGASLVLNYEDQSSDIVLNCNNLRGDTAEALIQRVVADLRPR